MSVRRLPDRPNLDQLHRQARELLRALHAGDAEAIADFHKHHPETVGPAQAKLADAQLALARSYGAPSWSRLVHAVGAIDAIHRDDTEAVRAIVQRDSGLMEFAAKAAAMLRRNTIVRMIFELAGKPTLSLAGAAYTLNVEETAVLLGAGATAWAADGIDHNTFEHLLGTDSRYPEKKHRILALYDEHGFAPPDTPIMALHRGRIDLLEAHLARDPGLLTRTFDITDIYPLAPACSKEPYTAQGTPVHNTTLLHIAAYFDELDIAAWLLDQGMDPNVRSAVDADRFGGYTPLFNTVVSQRNFWVNYGKGQPDEARFTRLLLDRGADPNVRATLRQRREEGHGGGPLVEYRDVTPLGWGERFRDRTFVSRESMRLIAERGGRP